MDNTIKHGSLYIKTSQGWVQIALPVNVEDVIGLTDALNNKLEINQLLTTDNTTTGKIKKQFIPAEILAGLTYGGTCTIGLNHTATASISTEGLYFLDDKNPQQELRAITNNSNHADYNGLFFIVVNTTIAQFGYETFIAGDWLIATSSGWHKIDNTDLITSVNNRKGAVNIYQNTHDAQVLYEVGDVVSNDQDLYICVQQTSINTPITNTNYWKSFGKDWTQRITGLKDQIDSMVEDAKKLPSYTVSQQQPSGTDYNIGSIWIEVKS